MLNHLCLVIVFSYLDIVYSGDLFVAIMLGLFCMASVDNQWIKLIFFAIVIYQITFRIFYQPLNKILIIFMYTHAIFHHNKISNNFDAKRINLKKNRTILTTTYKKTPRIGIKPLQE